MVNKFTNQAIIYVRLAWVQENISHASNIRTQYTYIQDIVVSVFKTKHNIAGFQSMIVIVMITVTVKARLLLLLLLLIHPPPPPLQPKETTSKPKLQFQIIGRVCQYPSQLNI